MAEAWRLARRMLGTCLLWLVWASASGTPLRVDTVDMLTTGGTGFAPPPYQVVPAGPAGAWRTAALPHVQPRPIVGTAAVTVHAAATAVTWYRLRAPPSAQARFLYLPRWKTDGRLAVYGDGRMLYCSTGGINWNGWNRPLWLALDGSSGAAPPTTLLLRIEHPPAAGGGISALWIGAEQELKWRYRLRYLLQAQLPAAASASFLAVGLFSLCVWLRLRGEAIYGLFFCIAVASFLHTLHYYVGEDTLPIAEEWFSWLTINALYWMVLIMHLFLNHLHRRIARRLDWSVSGLVAGVGLSTLPGLVPDTDIYAAAPLAYALLLALGTTLGLAGLIKSRRAASFNGTLLSIWGVTGMLIGVFDWLLQINVLDPEWIYLGPYTNVAAFLIFMYIVHHRYLQAQHEVRRANVSLQERLAEQARELKDSYGQLHATQLRQTRSEERQRLMQDMHDGMGSALMSALVVAEKGGAEPAVMADILRNCLDDLRLTIDSMEPVEEDLLLVLATLRHRIGRRLELAGISLSWQVQMLPRLPWLDPRGSLHVLRILQEAFTNIIKHARATRIAISTAADGDDVLVRLRDDGIGFAPQTSMAGTGKGLANQVRRAAEIGARLEWEASGAGTTLTLRLPIAQERVATADPAA